MVTWEVPFCQLTSEQAASQVLGFKDKWVGTKYPPIHPFQMKARILPSADTPSSIHLFSLWETGSLDHLQG